MEQSNSPGYKSRLEKGDLGSWTAEPDMDARTMIEAKEAIAPYEDYVVNGGLLADLERVAPLTRALTRRLRSRGRDTSGN